MKQDAATTEVSAYEDPLVLALHDMFWARLRQRPVGTGETNSNPCFPA